MVSPTKTTSPDIVKRVREKRLIFTVTTGRSGTAYLASIFGFAKGVCTLHEPEPEFAEVLRRIQTDPDRARRFWIDKKLPAIAKNPAGIYIETSHLACKGFLEPLVELGVIPDLIIHRRKARDVALSMYKMGTIPGRSDKGLKFYLSPSDSGVIRVSDWKSLKDYQLCYWYCLEIERRASHYRKFFFEQGARVTETTLSGLKSFAGLKNCFSELDLKMKRPAWLTKLRFLRSASVKVNESKETKKDVGIPGNIDKLERDVVNRIGSCESPKWLADIDGSI